MRWLVAHLSALQVWTTLGILAILFSDPIASLLTPWNAILQVVSDRDKATRAAALSTLEVVYLSEGQAIWSMLGRLSDQQHSLIEERFKYTDKQVS